MQNKRANHTDHSISKAYHSMNVLNHSRVLTNQCVKENTAKVMGK